MTNNKFDIITDPNPVLRMPTNDIVEFDLSLQQIIDKMVNSMRQSNGIGLAAPQVGLINKLIVLECPPSPDAANEEKKKAIDKGDVFPLTILINPKIKNLSKEQCNMVEGCLSFPNFHTAIKRPQKVVVSGVDRWGKHLKITACGLFSRAIQHELDHLDGVLLIDRMRKLKTVIMSNMELGLPVMKLIKNNPQFIPQFLISNKRITDQPAAINMVSEAKKLDIPVVFWKSEPQIFQKLQSIKPELIIVAGFGEILSERIINLPKYGTLNIHPSLLPKYRGPSPIQQTILDGASEAGVTIIKLTPQVDTGPIIAEMAVRLSGYEDGQVLLKALANIGAELLVDAVPYYIAGDLKPLEQESKDVSITKIIRKEDGRILVEDTPEIVERKIRAYYGWPYAYTFSNDKRIQLLLAHLDNSGKLVLDKVKPEGKKEMTFEEFRRGNKGPLDNLEEKLVS